MDTNYDSSWDDDESENNDEDAFDEIYSKWESRAWEKWLREKLNFPFLVERTEDEGDSFFSDNVKSSPFALGHTMEVLGIKNEDEQYGVILNVREKGNAGYVPLCDVEVKDKENINYWPVREYVVWFANS